MRRFVTILTAAVAVAAFSTMAFAQAATAAKTATATKPAAAAQPAAATTPTPAAKPVAATTQAPVAKPAAKPAKLSAKGEGKYDEASKVLTVGDKTFTLAPDAKIMMGAKAATTADLTGKHVMVTYTVVDGTNVASKVTIATPKTAAPKK
jgi:hypothetical protein